MLKPRNLILIVAFIFAPHSFAKNDENTPKTETKAKVDLSGLSTEEISIYQQGKITDGQHIAGGLVGTFIGFGTGHIVYQKYGSNGWIFTVGELGSIAVMMAGAVKATGGCFSGDSEECSEGFGVYTLGALAYLGFRVWEIIDVWTIPGRHNRKFQAIKTKAESQSLIPDSYHILPVVVSPNGVHKGISVGMTYNF